MYNVLSRKVVLAVQDQCSDCGNVRGVLHVLQIQPPMLFVILNFCRDENQNFSFSSDPGYKGSAIF